MEFAGDWEGIIATPPSFSPVSPSSDGKKKEYISVKSRKCLKTSNVNQAFLNPEFTSQFGNIPVGPDELESHELLICCETAKLDKDSMAEMISAEDIIKECRIQSDGSIIAEFYDLRYAFFYRNLLQGAGWAGNKLNVSFSPPRLRNENGSPVNNGTLVLFHVPAKLSNVDLSNLFEFYGAIRQIRSSPNNPTQRFIEFWDTRSAQFAMDDLNKHQFLGPSVIMEYSVPGGLRRKAEYNDSSYRPKK